MKKNMDKHVILGIHITDRLRRATAVQQVFTDYGCHIKTRLGLHETGADFCSPNGLVLLEVVAPDKTAKTLERKLAAIRGIEVKKMVFFHD
jgi:hypothetical protein